MNLSRAFTAIPSTKRSLLCYLSLFQSSYLSTAPTTRPKSSRKPKFHPRNPGPDPRRFPNADAAVVSPARIAPPPDPADWPRPVEIPWQPDVANSAHLIGYVAIPVQLVVAPDGRYWAVSVLDQQKTDFPQLCINTRIPIVFEGDLAQIAACHLRENDLIYITGQISGDPPPFAIEQRQTIIQVMVHNVSYVLKSWMMKKPLEHKELSSDCSRTTTKNAENVESLWQDLITNPKHWWDHRLDKKNGSAKPRFPDFKHKETGRPLWLHSAPEWILSELERVEFNVKHIYPKLKSNTPPMKITDSGEHNYSAPKRIQSELEGVNFDVKYIYPKLESDTLPMKIADDGKSMQRDSGANKTMLKGSKSMQQDCGANKTMLKGSKKSNILKKSRKVERAEISWKDLLENPDNWWDNRSNKVSPTYPDFKHKVTCEALWITSSSTPDWVLPNLPPIIPKKERSML